MKTMLKRADIPTTRAGFVTKWNQDSIFRAMARDEGFAVIGGNVIFPDGQVADSKVK